MVHQKFITIFLVFCLTNLPIHQCQVAQDLITWLCVQTINPTLCVSVLYNIPNTDKDDAPRLTEMMIQQPLHKSLGILHKIRKLIISGTNDTVMAGYYNTCLDDFGVAVSQGLRPASAKMRRRKNYDAVIPFVKIASDNITDCIGVFNGGANFSDFRKSPFEEHSFIVRDMTLVAADMLSVLQQGQ